MTKSTGRGKKTLGEGDFPDNKVHGDILRGMSHANI